MLPVDSTDYIHIPKRALRKAIGALLLGIALSLALHPILLPPLAYALIVNEPLQKAAAIVVLGGGSGERERTGARLYAEGWADTLITTGGPMDLPGLSDTTWAALSAKELVRWGVPESRIIQLPVTTSTCEDALASVARLPVGAKRVIIVTDPFHTRRAQWLFEKGAGSVEVIMVAADPSWFDPQSWWTEERSLIVVEQEYVKFVVNFFQGCR
jgi:uncharacterized SAM-binding protein YcdF (DUF218 family)